MKNTHLEHPEDMILTGDLSVLDALYDTSNEFSVKIDGSPAIVWGTNPETGQFFVGTKSVFNKKKIKINHDHEDIQRNHGHIPEVANILHMCLEYLPRTSSIIQGDFIGLGGKKVYKPNTITYEFPEVITQQIIIAPHTLYVSETTLKDAMVVDGEPEMFTTDDVYVVQPIVDKISVDAEPPPLNEDKIQFMDKKQAKYIKSSVNALIREGVELTDTILFDLFGCVYLVNLYQMVIEIKEDLMDSLIVYGAPKAYIEGEDMEIDGEGYVIKNDYYGWFKLVRREEFSFANFTQGKFN